MDERNSIPSEDESNNPTDASQALAMFYGTAKEVMDRYNHCVLCGANLHFSHMTDFSRNITQETAKCPECKIKVRRIMHRLQ
jgi:uncharacterized protein with PIN domain